MLRGGNRLKGKFRQMEFSCTAAGRYAIAMEQALSEVRQKRPVKPDVVSSTRLASGCLLYRVPTRFWRQS